MLLFISIPRKFVFQKILTQFSSQGTKNPNQNKKPSDIRLSEQAILQGLGPSAGTPKGFWDLDFTPEK
jgi:hypothetical protein